MKKLLIILTILFSYTIASGQSTVYQEKIFAANLKDTISYKVYIPQDWEGWDTTQAHPAIYAINYGMINGDYVAAQIAYFRKARYAMPNSLVVVIDASMQRMGYSYTTGDVSEEGRKFIAFIKNELIPAVNQKYNTSSFRTYLGHSFAASFGSFILRQDPDLFRGYLLLAPEKVGTEAPFHLTDKSIAEYSRSHTFIYCAVGQKDMTRRKEFAAEVGKALLGIPKEHMFFANDTIARANHDNILTLSFEFGLEHIYRFYTPYSGKDEKDAFADLKQVANRIRNYYDLDLEKNFTFYSPFAREAVSNNDSVSLRKILSYFNSPNLHGWNLMQFGQFCLKVNNKTLAAYYFNKAIDKISTTEMNNANGPNNLINCYRHLAFDIYNDEHEKAWSYLLKNKILMASGNKFVRNDGSALIDLGKYSAINKFKPNEGIAYLTAYQKGKFKSTYVVPYNLSVLYAHLGDEKSARKYAKIAFIENPKDKNVIDLAKKFNIQ